MLCIEILRHAALESYFQHTHTQNQQHPTDLQSHSWWVVSVSISGTFFETTKPIMLIGIFDHFGFPFGDKGSSSFAFHLIILLVRSPGSVLYRLQSLQSTIFFLFLYFGYSINFFFYPNEVMFVYLMAFNWIIILHFRCEHICFPLIFRSIIIIILEMNANEFKIESWFCATFCRFNENKSWITIQHSISKYHICQRIVNIFGIPLTRKPNVQDISLGFLCWQNNNVSFNSVIAPW